MTTVADRTEIAVLGTLNATLERTTSDLGVVAYTATVIDMTGPVTLYTATGSASAALAHLQSWCTQVNSYAASLQTAL